MSTRAHIDFYSTFNGNHVHMGGIYHHADGYPEHMIPSFKLALDMHNRKASEDSGFGYRINDIDITDYAAFYVLSEKPWEYLDLRTNEPTIRMMGNVYIDTTMHGDEEYVYRVRANGSQLFIEVYQTSEGFWDNPCIENCVLHASGTLDELLRQYPLRSSQAQAYS